MGGELKHTHYSPYGAPIQVPGTLLDCTDEFRSSCHSAASSELSADYMYSPRFGPVSCTGLPPQLEGRLTVVYLEHRADNIEWRITDVVADPVYTYRVKITNRTLYEAGEGPAWHSVEYGIGASGAWVSTHNPHPGYDHWEASCPNCGY